MQGGNIYSCSLFFSPEYALSDKASVLAMPKHAHQRLLCTIGTEQRQVHALFQRAMHVATRSQQSTAMCREGCVGMLSQLACPCQHTDKPTCSIKPEPGCLIWSAPEVSPISLPLTSSSPIRDHLHLHFRARA